MSKYDWLLFFHITGAFFLVGGTVMAGTFTILALRRRVPSEIAQLLGLVRLSLPFIYAGVTLTLVFGLWLVHAAGQGYSFGDAWVIAALVIWVAANAAGGMGGKRQEATLAEAKQLAATNDEPNGELATKLRDPVGLALSFGSGLMVFAVLALMIWKPGA
ncbi:MAG: DUF2269 family protein [Acidobacteria bacterium]|jgi:uncharacterized membrane protein|nr:DUF2269 family protein [Acidobacteriota bacterium]